MEIHDTENADHFDTKDECLGWIADRIVRFKLKIAHGVDRNGNFAVGQLQKSDGRIFVTTAEGFKTTSLDEPLAKYAAPHKQENEKWIAVMEMRG
jgi:hypothetical protein